VSEYYIWQKSKCEGREALAMALDGAFLRKMRALLRAAQKTVRRMCAALLGCNLPEMLLTGAAGVCLVQPDILGRTGALSAVGHRGVAERV